MRTPRESARRIGIAGGLTVLGIGILYVGVIVTWLLVERTPREPIADPYLAVMEVLTIASATALVVLLGSLSVLTREERRGAARASLFAGAMAAVLTIAVHVYRLAVVRPAWRAGRIEDYRLIWPSPLFAVEYLAWDLLVGLSLVLAAVSLAGSSPARGSRSALALAGALCLAGAAGPVTGYMALQNVAVLGYAIVLPVAAGLLARDFAWRSRVDSRPS